jgi:hypothetical protein
VVLLTALQFGKEAYKRDFAGATEIKLLNRFVEQMPTNLVDKFGLLARPGTELLATVGNGVPRKLYSKVGLFDSDLFIVVGGFLYRHVNSSKELVSISGLIGGGLPKFTWDSGPGYQRLFVSDGSLLQYYNGGSLATGTLSGTATNQVLDIGGAYYSWNAAVDTNSPDGSSAHPWLANPGSDPFTALANMLNFVGIPGTNFSTNLRGASTTVVAAANGGPPATSVILTSISSSSSANSIATTVYSGSGVSFTGSTLSGAGTNSLEGIYIPTGEAINALCNLDHYIIASVANSNKMFFLEPGSTTVNTLDFFSKESNPDPVLDLLTAGDVFIAAGAGSIETWYPTGNADAPFAPIEGRTIARGIVDGSLVLVQDTPVFVGADGVVYAVGQGLTRISNHGIEERIRELMHAQAISLGLAGAGS